MNQTVCGHFNSDESFFNSLIDIVDEGEAKCVSVQNLLFECIYYVKRE